MRRSKGFPKLGAGQFTRIPNIFLDEYSRDLSCAELRVMQVILRKTYGWRKDTDAISFSQFEELTGLGRKAIAKAIKALEQDGYILVERGRTSTGSRAVNIYCVKPEAEQAAADGSVADLELLK
jgi:phage replication O-like protein O